LRLQGFGDDVLKSAKKAEQDKKPEGSKGDFLEAHNEVSYIYGGSDPYESMRKQKLITWEVMVVAPTCHPRVPKVV
jgi:hypothetical protein